MKETVGFVGLGGMGAVYLAEHVLLRRPCAVKLIRPDQAGDPRSLIRFEREVQATATLTHPNTIEIFDYGHAEDGTFYYVMEYLPGMNLEDLVEQHGPMPPERTVHLLRQVCQALREAHGIGLIHRDIKPSNIFACERGKVYDVAKLLDFGLVKNVGLVGDDARLTQEGAFTGSPAFMSPEQAVGRRQLDARSDIYNVGAVSYFLATGQLLFDRGSALQMLHAHAYEPLVPIHQFQEAVPADLQRVILRCLEKDPDRRYQDAASLDKALAACASAGRWTLERAEDWWRRKGGEAGYDGGKKSKGRKRPIVVDTLGLLLAVAVTAANLDDGTHAPRVLGKLEAARYPRLKVVLADNKYHNRALDRWLREHEVPYTIEVVTKAEGTPGFVPVKIRWVVERAIAWLGRCRRLSKDYEYNTASSETWIQIAAIQQMTRRLRPDASNGQAAFKYPKKVKKAA